MSQSQLSGPTWLTLLIQGYLSASCRRWKHHVEEKKCVRRAQAGQTGSRVVCLVRQCSACIEVSLLEHGIEAAQKPFPRYYMASGVQHPRRIAARLGYFVA